MPPCWRRQRHVAMDYTIRTSIEQESNKQLSLCPVKCGATVEQLLLLTTLVIRHAMDESHPWTMIIDGP